MGIPTLNELIPPGEHPILNALGVLAVLLTCAITLGLIFLAVRDGHKKGRGIVTLRHNIRWDEDTDPNNPGWLILCEIEPGRFEWMSEAPGCYAPRDADDDELDDLVAATQAWHGCAT